MFTVDGLLIGLALLVIGLAGFVSHRRRETAVLAVALSAAGLAFLGCWLHALGAFQ